MWVFPVTETVMVWRKFRQDTETRSADPLLTPNWPPYWPYKINGKMKIKKAQNYQWDRFKFISKFSLPQTSKMADAFQISNSRVLLWLFSEGFVDGKSSTE